MIIFLDRRYDSNDFSNLYRDLSRGFGGAQHCRVRIDSVRVECFGTS